jgi:small conductance mechanosensitive channel
MKSNTMNLIFDPSLLADYVSSHGLAVLLKLAGAIAAWIIGRWLIKLLRKLLTRLLVSNDKVDTTISQYITSFSSVVLTIGLAMAILGYLGVHTTSFAALLAGAGLAVGTAWGGLLTHFSAGVFLQVLRPFKVGDYVNVGGIEGDVLELGLFGTTVLSTDHVTTIIGNNKVFSEVIKNYSNQAYRRANCTVLIDHGVPLAEAINRLNKGFKQLPMALKIPAAEVGVLEVNQEGIRLAVRPFCDTKDHMRLCFATYEMVARVFKEAGYPPPRTYIEHQPAESYGVAKVSPTQKK